MSLFIEVQSPGLDISAAQDIVGGVDADTMLCIEAVRPRTGISKTIVYLRISEGHGDACSLLSDSADWNSETWDFLPSAIPRLIETVLYIGASLPSGFSISFVWAGEDPRASKRLPIESFVDLIRDNEVGTRRCYEIV